MTKLDRFNYENNIVFSCKTKPLLSPLVDGPAHDIVHDGVGGQLPEVGRVAAGAAVDGRRWKSFCVGRRTAAVVVVVAGTIVVLLSTTTFMLLLLLLKAVAVAAVMHGGHRAHVSPVVRCAVHVRAEQAEKENSFV